MPLWFTHLALTMWLSLSALPQDAAPVVLRGVVADSSGAIVTSARVVLTGQDGNVQTALTDSSGTYVFARIAPGTYRLEASAPQLVLTQPITVTVGGSAQTQDIELSVAPESERVEVSADAASAVSTDPNANAGALVVRGTDLDALADNPEDLAADLQALAGPSAGPNGGSVYVDGFSGADLPSKDSIREIRINQNPFSPEYDKLGLGRIEVLTKPGSAKLHGNLNYNLGTDHWNSRNPYSMVKAPLLLNEWENTLGGPINRRASFALDANQNNVNNGSLVNAVTLDPVGLQPTPFFDVFKTIQRRTSLSPRIDYQLNQKNTLTLHYTFTHGNIVGAGIGGFNLISVGYHTRYTVQTVQAIESALIGSSSVNETRFQYYRNALQMTPNSTGPTLQVSGSFTGGGAQIGSFADTQNNFELQNITTLARGIHTWKFGMRSRGQLDDNLSPQNFNGTFTFSGNLAPELDSDNQPVLDGSGQPILTQITSIESYRRTLYFQNQGDTAAQIRALGGEPSQFSINTGAPELAVHQFDIGVFAGDDWQARRNLTLSLGLRYETQTNIHDATDFAPRIGLAWAPGSGHNGPPSLVVRAGFGIFYDRLALASALTAERYNGFSQEQYVVSDPQFYPTVPSISSLGGLQSTPVIEQISGSFHAPYIMQSALTVERQLPGHTTLSITYTNSQGSDILRSGDVNAPLPGTYTPGVPNSGTYPLGHPGAVFQMESSGRYSQNQLITNVTSKLTRGISLAGSYVLNRAMSDSDGANTFPADPYSLRGEYGPASTDVRHRVSLSGTVDTKWNVRFSPLITIQSGLPFDITTGQDLYGTTLLNSRPGIATDSARPGLVQTPYGLLDPNPVADEIILPRNFGRGPGQMFVNVRVGKTFGLGPASESSSSRPQSSSFFSDVFTPTPNNHRLNLTFSMSIRNLLNHNNPGPIVGNIASPLFGRANQLAGNVNGEGFSENANNRRLEFQTRLTF